MIVMPANNSNAHKLEKQYPGRMGLLLGPSGWRDPKSLTYACDNDCFSVWSKGKAWSEDLWWAMLGKVDSCESRPRWVAIPDVVGDAVATYQRWTKYAPRVADRFEFPLALVVQDGMTPKSTQEFIAANAVQPEVVFVGGTTEWKRKTLWHWCHTFPRVHVGRVSRWDRVLPGRPTTARRSASVPTSIVGRTWHGPARVGVRGMRGIDTPSHRCTINKPTGRMHAPG